MNILIKPIITEKNKHKYIPYEPKHLYEASFVVEFIDDYV